MHLHYVEHMPKNDELIPTNEVAVIHGVNVATVNRWAKAGLLPVAVKAPGPKGANLFLRSVVLAKLAADTEAETQKVSA